MPRNFDQKNNGSLKSFPRTKGFERAKRYFEVDIDNDAQVNETGALSNNVDLQSTNNSKIFPVLESETACFFENVLERLQRPFDDKEEMEIFYKNILEETFGHEMAVVSNVHGSTVMTFVFRDIENEDVLQQFLDSVDIKFACTHRYASRVAEWLLLGTLRLLQLKGREKRKLKNWMTDFVQFCNANVYNLINDVFASKVLLILVQVLSGKSVPLPSKKTESGSVLNIPKPENFNFKRPKSFKENLETFIGHIIMEKENFHDLCTRNLSASFLQNMLHILKLNEPEMCQRVIGVLLEKIFEPSFEDQETLPMALTHQTCTFLVQVLLELADEETYAKLILLVQPHIESLCIHKIGNFVLQTMLVTCKTKEQFQKLFDILIPHLESILMSKNTGILEKFSRGCVEMDTCQAKFVQELRKLLKLNEDEGRNELFTLLTLKLTSFPLFKENKESKQCSSFPSSLHGSLVIQNMLKFHKTDKISGSILALPQHYLKSLVNDRNGSYIVDVFLTSNFVPEKKKSALIKKLLEFLLDMLKSGPGFHVLQSIFFKSTLTHRTEIAEQLSHCNIKDFEYGTKAMNKFGLNVFRKSKEQWTASQNQNTTKRKILDDIVQQVSKKNKN